jgi:hypothetical protein
MSSIALIYADEIKTSDDEMTTSDDETTTSADEELPFRLGVVNGSARQTS